MCPATMCPYMGSEINESGSPWTGEREGECEESCGWHQGGGCLVPGDLYTMLSEMVDEMPDDEYLKDEKNWVDCEYSENCQWQLQGDHDLPCPPRLAILLNIDPEKCLF